MEIRPDFHSVEDILQRALVYAQQFHEFSFENWAHLKHKEDFKLIYDLPKSQRYPLEDVYRYGRNLANQLSELLSGFNYPDNFPTFKSFVDEIEKVLEPTKSKASEVINKAEAVLPHLEYHIWSIEQMIGLYRKQLDLVSALKNWVDLAKRKQLYLDESGISDKVKTPESAVGNRVEKTLNWFKNHPVLSPLIVIAIIIIAIGNFTGALQNMWDLIRQSGDSEAVHSPIAQLPFDLQLENVKDRIRYLSEEYLHKEELSLAVVIGPYGDNVLDNPELYDWNKVLEELEKQGFIKILKKKGRDVEFRFDSIYEDIHSHQGRIFAYVSKDGSILRSKNFPWKITKETTSDGEVVYLINDRFGDPSEVTIVPEDQDKKYTVYVALGGIGIKFFSTEEQMPNFEIRINK